MTLDEAALIWGNGVLEGHVWSVINEGCDFVEVSREKEAWYQLHALTEGGDGDCADIDLACVMYAQDVAEGRHR